MQKNKLHSNTVAELQRVAEVQRCRVRVQSCRAAVAEVQNRFRGAGAGSEDIWFRTGSEVHRCILGA